MQAMTDMAADCQLPIDFTKTPFFLTFIEQDIADEILKAHGFFDHPVSGDLTHGMNIHGLQVLFGFEAGVLNEKLLAAIIDHRLFSSLLDLEPNAYSDKLVSLGSGQKPDETIVMANHRPILNGRTPNSLQALLVFGLLSQMVEKGLVDDSVADQSLKLLGLEPCGNRETDREILIENVRAIRALEYAVAGAMSRECDFAARLLGEQTGNPNLNTMNDLYLECPDANWGVFTSTAETRAMLKGMVAHYLDHKSEFTVYQQIKVEGQFKLQPLLSIDDFDPKAGYVVYPAGSEPPEVCR